MPSKPLTLSEFLQAVAPQLTQDTVVVTKERKGYSVVQKKNLQAHLQNGWTVVHEGGPVMEPKGARKAQPEAESKMEPELNTEAEGQAQEPKPKPKRTTPRRKK